MERVKKLSIIILIISSIAFTYSLLTNMVMADQEYFTPEEINVSMDDQNEAAKKTREIAGKAAYVVLTIGQYVSAIILLLIAIKYIKGSAEEKSDYKKSMVPYVIGFVITFGATSILSFIYKIYN